MRRQGSELKWKVIYLDMAVDQTILDRKRVVGRRMHDNLSAATPRSFAIEGMRSCIYCTLGSFQATVNGEGVQCQLVSLPRVSVNIRACVLYQVIRYDCMIPPKKKRRDFDV